MTRQRRRRESRFLSRQDSEETQGSSLPQHEQIHPVIQPVILTVSHAGMIQRSDHCNVDVKSQHCLCRSHLAAVM